MIIERQNNEVEAKYLYDKIIEFNSRMMPSSVAQNYEQINLVLRDDDGQIQGGILGYWVWNWIHMDILWIDEKLRGQGYGSQLLSEIERMATDRGCECIELDTYSFQAPDFYKARGYENCGTIEYAQGQVARYYMVKRL